MNHHDHVRLLREALKGAGSRWLELGSGDGAFTLALADLLGGRGSIRAIDRERGALDRLGRAFGQAYPGVVLESRVADFTRPLGLAPGTLDGILMANSLHYVQNKEGLLAALVPLLAPLSGRFVLVEYDTDRGNTWVPWPLSYRTWEALAGGAGLAGTRQTGSVPSRFLGSMFSAMSYRMAQGSDGS